MCLIKANDKIKHLSKRYAAMLKVTKALVCWTNDKIQLQLESVNKCKCKCHEY